jgi:hypothetical protein
MHAAKTAGLPYHGENQKCVLKIIMLGEKQKRSTQEQGKGIPVLRMCYHAPANET